MNINERRFMEYSLFLTVCFIASLTMLALTLLSSVFVKRRRFAYDSSEFKKKKYFFTTFQIFIIGAFVSVFILVFPLHYVGNYAGDSSILSIFKCLIISVFSAIRLFSLGESFSLVDSALGSIGILSEPIGTVYTVYYSLLYFVAPFLTFGFALSFFKNISASIKYFFKKPKEIYYFSELNDNSLALARNVKNVRRENKPLIVFCSYEGESDYNSNLIDRTKKLGAICLSKELSDIRIKKSERISVRKFYFIGNDESCNVKDSLELIEECVNTPYLNTRANEVYVFATSAGSEMLIDSANKGNLKVRRVDVVRNLVYRVMEDYPIFDRYTQDGEAKKLNVLIAGVGKCGTEILRALCWCGQMIGYELNVHVVDKKKRISTILESFAPELSKLNGEKIKGEEYHNVRFYDKIDVLDSTFTEVVESIGEITTAYVTLGDDDLNIETAKKLSILTARYANVNNCSTPLILSAVYDTIKTQTFMKNGGFKSINGENIDVKLIGDSESCYSIYSVELPEIEKEALECHLKWSDYTNRSENTDKFEKLEYYRRASMAESLHLRLKDKLNINFNTQSENKLKELEHKRWNAFMRSEGFVLGEKKDFVAKTHPMLVPYEELSEYEKDKDGAVIKKK